MKDEFAAAVEAHRHELQVHCYRMLGSFDESEDLLQETFLRAWRRRETYAGRGLRPWLYKIATNTCLDYLEQRPRMPTPVGEINWLQPIPDELLDGVIERETIELALMIALQYLTPQPRAALILRDVLGWRARAVADLLEVSEASVNSALQRARAVLKEHLPEDRGEWAAEPVERELVARYLACTEAADAAGLKALMHEDARFMMPPETGVYRGRDAIVDGWFSGGLGSPEFGVLRLVETRANRQPALANYHLKPGAGEYVALAIDVLDIRDGAVADIIAFGASSFEVYGLPNTLPV